MENLKIKGRICIETESHLKIGSGRAELLEQIHRLGSISKAAKTLNIPYRKAWGIVKDINDNSAQALVVKEVGGKTRGKSRLTGYGREMVRKFRMAEEGFMKFSQEIPKIK